MPGNVYCPFCGVILLPDPYHDDLASPLTLVRPWYAEIRGIHSPNTAPSSVAITGLGIISRRNTLHAPLSSDLSYFNVENEMLEEWRICAPSDGRWCFGFHNSCWKLLLLRLGQKQEGYLLSETAIAESIFCQLLCTPCIEASSFAFGHDYDGAAQTHKFSGRPNPVDSSLPMYADPGDILREEELEAAAVVFWNTYNDPKHKGLECACPATTSSTAISHHSHQDLVDDMSAKSSGTGALPQSPNNKRKETNAKLQGPSRDIFDQLSLELIFEMLSYLSLEDVLKFRLVCQRTAALAAIVTLPQSYWRSRFCIGQEFDFLLPRYTDSRDWSSLFFGTRVALKEGSLSLINRKRIRQLLEPIAALVELQTTLRNRPYGSVLNPSKMECDHLQCTDGMTMEVTGSFSGQITSTSADDPLHEGCRVLHHRTLPLRPLHEKYQQRIGISTIKLGTQTFISGINLFPQQECNEAGLVGYHIPTSEKWIGIPSPFRVESICVAFCSHGLTGIKFIFDDVHSSGWIGDNRSPKIARGILSIPKTSDRPLLIVGLDHFKVVSLGIGKLAHSTETPSTRLPQDAPGSWHLHSHLWIPHPPNGKDLDISSFVPDRALRAFEPLTNVDFGGSGGLLLGALTRLTFYMESTPNPFIGIEVFHTNQSPLLLGSRGGCELSFFINGSKGERITQLDTLEYSMNNYSGTALDGLQISTNYGRNATFAPLRCRLNTSLTLTLVPPLGNTITGFVFLGTEYKNRFTRVGLQSQKLDNQPMIPDVLDLECHRIPDDQLRYDETFTLLIDSSMPGNYQTYASLKNVRRIQASTGIQGRSRSPNYISGLKIEYHDHPSPGVLGQWMSELDDVFELSPDEDIHSLSIWLAPVGFSIECRGLEISQVAAIFIETTHSRSVTFRSPEYQPFSDDTVHYRCQREHGEDLTAISWVFNIRCDRIRAVVSPNKSQLIPTLVPEQDPPFDQTQKLYLEIQNQNHDGERESIVKAEAYFRSRAIVGLLFGYSLGSIASIGDLDTPSRQTVHLELNSRVVGMSVTGEGRSLVEIEFQVESDDQLSSRRLRLSVDSTHDPASAVPVDDAWRDVWCRDASSALQAKEDMRSIRDRVYEAPVASRLVGIYAGSQTFSYFGALYEPRSPH